MAKTLKILCIHGSGGHTSGGAWEQSAWIEPLKQCFDSGMNDVVLAPPVIVCLDDVFARYELSPSEWGAATAKLTGGAVSSSVNKKRGMNTALDMIAGMIVQWVGNEKLRKETRRVVVNAINEFNPQVICGHSLGSLVAYDTFLDSETAGLAANRFFVSLGSPIACPFVKGSYFGGRIAPLPKAKYWYHLYNKNDTTFTAPVYLSDDNFMQIDVASGTIQDQHRPSHYLADQKVKEIVGAGITLDLASARSFDRYKKSSRTVHADHGGGSRSSSRVKNPDHRALLIGINDYPNEQDRLDGCVNDVFLMSSVLQECGFKPDTLRVVLNNRATTAGILERIEWLLSDSKEGDVRFLYYSGHGAQMPNYGGFGDPVDRLDEVLVPYDFDWTPEHSIMDDTFNKIYSQLPYGMNFVTILDCCHSGGMTREGGSRIRGINPPDDIRHRMLRWDAGLEMWRVRDINDPGKNFSDKFPQRKSKATNRLGFAAQLRGLEPKEYDLKRNKFDHKGPYMPLLIYACGEKEYSYEYRHGVVSYGAFTYCFAKCLRQLKKTYPSTSMVQLISKTVASELRDLGYKQTPAICGPKEKMQMGINKLSVAT